PVLTQAFNLVSGNDLNSTLTQLSELNSIQSDSTGTAVWTFRLTDFENADGRPTVLRTMVFSSALSAAGANTLDDFLWTIEGVAGTVDTMAGTISFSGLNVIAADNGAM